MLPVSFSLVSNTFKDIRISVEKCVNCRMVPVLELSQKMLYSMLVTEATITKLILGFLDIFWSKQDNIDLNTCLRSQV